MPVIKITKSAADAIEFAVSGQVIYKDTQLKGFGLKVGTGTKTYIAEGTPNGRTRLVTMRWEHVDLEAGTLFIPEPKGGKKRAFIRTFQKDKGLEVDGFLKPGGPTIGKIGSLLGGGNASEQSTNDPGVQAQGFWGGPNNDQPGVPLPGDAPQSPRHPGGREPWSFDPPTTFPMPKPQPPSGGPGLPGGELTPQQQLEALIRIMNGGKPAQTPPTQPKPAPGETPDDDGWDPQGGCFGTGGWKPGYPKLKPGRSNGPFPSHTINQEGIDASQAYAEMLVRDSAPSQTARMLKRAIDDYGDQGRGDVADLLARFQKIDGGKAESLRRELHKATGEMLPYRLAPLGEGFREPTEEDRIAAAPKVPFGSAHGADRWAAGNMADVLLGRGDYGDGITHFRGEVGRNRAESMPYLAAVHERMSEKNPGLAAKFATQMQKAGLTAEATEKEEASSFPVPIPPAPNPAPTPRPPEPQPGSDQKPEPALFPVPIPPAPTPAPAPSETTPPVQGKPEVGEGGPIIKQPISPVAKPGPIPPPKPGETDIVQPPGAPGGPMKPAPDLHPSVTIEFDGKEFKAIEDGKVVKSWSAVSGRPGYQGAEHQGDKNNGPLPEGEWVLRQDKYQKIGPKDAVLGVIKPGKHGAWPGSIPAWGTERVWLEPGKDTDTKGRDKFSVHGGWQPGSAGCVDLTGKMGEFADYFRKLGKDVTVRVRYNR